MRLPQIVIPLAPFDVTLPFTVELVRMSEAPAGTRMGPFTVVFDTHVVPEAVKPAVGLDTVRVQATVVTTVFEFTVEAFDADADAVLDSELGAMGLTWTVTVNVAVPTPKLELVQLTVVVVEPLQLQPVDGDAETPTSEVPLGRVSVMVASAAEVGPLLVRLTV
jgi:hypothetical protein